MNIILVTDRITQYIPLTQTFHYVQCIFLFKIISCISEIFIFLFNVLTRITDGHIPVHHRYHLPCHPHCLKFITS